MEKLQRDEQEWRQNYLWAMLSRETVWSLYPVRLSVLGIISVLGVRS